MGERGIFFRGHQVELASLSEIIFIFSTLFGSSSSRPLVSHCEGADGNPRELLQALVDLPLGCRGAGSQREWKDSWAWGTEQSGILRVLKAGCFSWMLYYKSTYQEQRPQRTCCRIRAT